MLLTGQQLHNGRRWHIFEAPPMWAATTLAETLQPPRRSALMRRSQRTSIRCLGSRSVPCIAHACSQLLVMNRPAPHLMKIIPCAAGVRGGLGTACDRGCRSQPARQLEQRVSEARSEHGRRLSSEDEGACRLLARRACLIILLTDNLWGTMCLHSAAHCHRAVL